MPINGIGNGGTVDTQIANRTKAEEDRTTLDYSDFLKLFVTSLQYQDPTAPMDNAEMMNQMSQIGFMQAVSEMQDGIRELKESVMGNQIQQGATMLGKQVTGADASGIITTGTVDKVQLNDGLLSLLVDNKTITIGSVISVENGTDKLSK